MLIKHHLQQILMLMYFIDIKSRFFLLELDPVSFLFVVDPLDLVFLIGTAQLLSYMQIRRGRSTLKVQLFQ